MKLPLSWLREWVDLPEDPHEVAERLTSIGFEVESIAPVAGEFTEVVVAQITQIAAHPQAEKLQICQVSDGSGASLQIVCGASNARQGLKSALARIGAELPGGVQIKRAKLRGVDSAGMLCSARELGLSESHEGILELPEDAPLGASLRSYMELDDSVLEIAITPNRGDAMSVLGVARELAALAGSALRAPEVPPVAATGTATFPIHLSAGAGCARFASRVIRGVDNTRATPAWLQERLRRAGLRSISPVVDVTNLVLLELGQPMHAYDLGLLHGGITVRRARPDEPLRLLDGQELKLAEDVLVIADQQSAVGLAGIMGGERTMISASSCDLLLEVAWFDPAVIAGRARRYGQLTDASQRFERGVDPAGQERALARATRLLLDLVGGEAGPVQMQELPAEIPAARSVLLRAQRLDRLLGINVPSAVVEQRLRALGLQVSAQPQGWQTKTPTWRFDLAIEVDLIEEVARLGGFAAIPEAAVVGARSIAALPESHLDERTLLQLLAARGYHEVITFGFVDPQLQAQLFADVPPITLLNPISSQLAVMRCSLWPGLIQAARENLRRQQERVRLFEMATRFTRGPEGQVVESKSVAGLVVGTRWPEQWGSSREAADFYDVKGDIEALLALHGGPDVHRFEAAADVACLHPGRAARILRDGKPIGLLGELHPALTTALNFTYAPLLFELDGAPLSLSRPAGYEPLSVYPHIRRDLSFTVEASEPFGRIAERVSVAASTSLKELRVFDIYQGQTVESGRKSIALGLILQELTRTLTDEDADRIVAAVVVELQSSLGARIRE
jgi:phenylalanyl-tRNA synthetase beta chain